MMETFFKIIGIIWIVTKFVAIVCIPIYFIIKKYGKKKDEPISKPTVMINPDKYFDLREADSVNLRHYFIGQAMHPVVLEMQETVPASFKDWVKQQLHNLLGMTFLKVNYKDVEGAYAEAARRAVRYADAIIMELSRVD